MVKEGGDGLLRTEEKGLYHLSVEGPVLSERIRKNCGRLSLSVPPSKDGHQPRHKTTHEPHACKSQQVQVERNKNH